MIAIGTIRSIISTEQDIILLLQKKKKRILYCVTGQTSITLQVNTTSLLARSYDVFIRHNSYKYSY